MRSKTKQKTSVRTPAKVKQLNPEVRSLCWLPGKHTLKKGKGICALQLGLICTEKLNKHCDNEIGLCCKKCCLATGVCGTHVLKSNMYLEEERIKFGMDEYIGRIEGFFIEKNGDWLLVAKELMNALRKKYLNRVLRAFLSKSVPETDVNVAVQY